MTWDSIDLSKGYHASKNTDFLSLRYRAS